MNEKLEILQCLIENNIFSPSASALAKELGYKGKMTVYRLMDGNVSSRIIDEIWRKIQETFEVEECEMYLLYSIQQVTLILQQHLLPEVNKSDPEWISNVFRSFIKEEYDYSEKVKEEIVPELKDLRKDEPDLFWRALLLLYIKAAHINPYRKDFRQLWMDWIDGVEHFFSEIYPENRQAKGGVVGMKAMVMQEMKISNLWLLLYGGSVICRIYTEPEFIRTLAAMSSRLIDCPEFSCWIVSDVEYKSEKRAWVWIQNNCDTVSHGYYIVYQVQAGKDIETFQVEDMYIFRFAENIGNYLHIMNSQQVVSRYDYEYDTDKKVLCLAPSSEEETSFQLPAVMHCISTNQQRYRKNEKVWFRLLDKFVKGKGRQLFQKIGGSLSQGNIYEVRDVIINRKHLSLVLMEAGVEKEYRLPLSEYSFLTTLIPAQEIWISRHTDDAEVYIEWPKLGYAIKLSEFTLIK